MANKDFDDKILENVKLKIAISNFEKEEKPMSKQKVLKMVAMFVVIIGLLASVTYAGSVIYEKIFKEPEKIENYIDELKVTDEDLANVISKEEAVNKAKEELKRYKIDLDVNKIQSVELEKNPNYDEITYIISLSKTEQFFIDARTGVLNYFCVDEFLSLEELEKCTSTREDVLEQAKLKLKEYGYDENEYKISYVNSNNGDDENKSYLWYIWFSKEYDGVFNEYQSISMTFIPKINKVHSLSISDEPFENNEIKITMEQAIDIAKEKDKIINSENYIQKGVDAKLEIVRVNPEVYLKENGLENGNKVATLEDGSTYSYYEYKMNGRVRKAYKVTISYENRPLGLTRTYYVDVTTGEVIGGEDIFDKKVDENITD